MTDQENSYAEIRLHAAALVFISCADDPVQPHGDLKPQFSTTAAGRYILELRGSDVTSLRAAVAALGGTLEFAHVDAGIATVSGLTPEGAAALGRTNGIGAVHQDIRVQLVPEAETIGAAVPAQLLGAADPTAAAFYAWQWHLRRSART